MIRYAVIAAPMLLLIEVSAKAQPSIAQPVVPGYQTAPASNAGAPTFTPYGSIVPVQQQSAYPTGAVPVTATGTGTTAGVTISLANAATTKTWICGLSIRANATAAATGQATVTGGVGGTMSFLQYTAPLASGMGITEEQFNPCIPSSAVNTAITIVSAAPGSGGNISVNAWGYQD